MPHNGIISRFAFQPAETKKTALGIALCHNFISSALKPFISSARNKVCKNFILHHNHFSPFPSLPPVTSFSET
jgi:hypothetical protein